MPSHTALGTEDENHLPYHHNDTFATLPAAATAGRLGRVTDTTRGLWMDDGSRWWPIGPYVNATDFGIVGNGTTDDTAALQAALTAAAGKTLFIPAGTYKVRYNSGTGKGLAPSSNTTIIMDPSCILKADVMAWTDDGVLSIYSVSNVKVFGGEIDGQRASNTTGAMNGIYVRDATNIHIEGVVIHHIPAPTVAGGSAGDGVLVRGLTNPGSTYVTITRCYIHNCVRQGISITKAQHVVISDNHITDIVGTDPGGGIDIEPDASDSICEFITIENNYIKNAQWGIVLDGGSSVVAPHFVSIVDNFIDEGITLSMLKVVAARHILVQGNHFRSVDDAPTASSAGRILLSAISTRFIGNHCYGSGGTATNEGRFIRVANHLTVIAYNEFTNTAGSAIEFFLDSASTLRRFLVYGNQFVNCGIPTTGNVIRTNISGGGAFNGLCIEQNVISDSRTPAAGHGILLTDMSAAMFADCRVQDNLIMNVTATITNLPAGGETAGNATLVAGTKTVAAVKAVTASIITLTRKTTSGTPGILTYTIDTGVGFTINSSEATDVGIISWRIENNP